MIFTLLYQIFQDKLFIFLFGIPIYICVLSIWEHFHYYSSLIIGIDLFTVIHNQKKYKSINDTLQTEKNISLLSNLLDFQKKKENKIINQYKPKQMNIDDTIKHTLDKIN